MKKKARTYTTEFKTQAIQLVNEPDANISQVARDLGITTQTLGTWVRNARKATALDRPVFTGRGIPALNEHEKRIKELERENAILRQEREILKAATKFFAKEIK